MKAKPEKELENKIMNLTKKINEIKTKEGVNTNDEIRSLLDERSYLSKKWINMRKNYHEDKAIKNWFKKIFRILRT
jgi:hypothetical protein|tara:strand:- start:726 stop:953 length:228 start_codon:yes stop_codon:yes gene_type:complete